MLLPNFDQGTYDKEMLKHKRPYKLSSSEGNLGQTLL